MEGECPGRACGWRRSEGGVEQWRTGGGEADRGHQQRRGRVWKRPSLGQVDGMGQGKPRAGSVGSVGLGEGLVGGLADLTGRDWVKSKREAKARGHERGE